MTKSKSLVAALLVSTVIISGCSATGSKYVGYAPGGPDAKADRDMKAVLGAQSSLHPKPIETLSAAEARQQPSPADGAKLVLKEKGMNPNASLGVKTVDLTYPAAIGTQAARVYIPEGFDARKDQPLPVIVYYHGGGWVIADLDTYDSTPRGIAKGVDAIVVSVEYRHAPESKFPAAHDDSFAAYKWVLNNAAKWGGDPRRVAVMGESAGGNLAINTAIKARDERIQAPLYQVLVYPVAGVDMGTKSYVENADAKPLNKPMMKWFVKNTIKSDRDKQDPRLDLIGKADLHNLPPTTIITAEIDPLRSDGFALADKLRQSGVEVNSADYKGVTHEFFGMALVVDDAKAANAVVVSDLKAALK